MSSVAGNLSTIKSFAQMAAPQVVSATIPTKGTTPECGLLVERLKNSTLDEYAKALEAVAGKKSLIFIGQNPENLDYVLAFLEKPILVDKVVSLGITVKSKWLCVTHISQPATKLVISDVMPFIPDTIILNACRPFGKPVYEELCRIPSSIRSQEYRHVLSFRRELLIVVDKDKRIPEHIVVYSHDKIYKLGVTAPGLVCYNCNRQGHKASLCRNPHTKTAGAINENGDSWLDQDALNEVNTINNIPEATLTARQRPLQMGVQGSSWPQFEKAGPSRDAKGQDTSLHKAFEPRPHNSDPPKGRIDDTSQPFMNKKLLPHESQEGAWQTVGKKGKIVSPSLMQSMIAQVNINKKKTPKLQKSSDVTALRQFAPLEESDCSQDQSAEVSQLSSGNDNRRRKESSSMTGITSSKVDVHQATGNSPIPLQQGKMVGSKKDGDQSLESGGFAQLKKLMSQQLIGKSKQARKDIDLAQPIVEDLLQSVWSLRTAKRRAVLMEFQERHMQLNKYIDVVMATIPSSLQSSQVYKSLSNIKQDLRIVSTADGRSSRKPKT